MELVVRNRENKRILRDFNHSLKKTKSKSIPRQCLQWFFSIISVTILLVSFFSFVDVVRSNCSLVAQGFVRGPIRGFCYLCAGFDIHRTSAENLLHFL